MHVSRMGQGLLCVAAMALILACATVRLPFAFGQTQPEPERFWLAGRYDGNRVIIYFDTAQFDNKLPADQRKITDPVTPGFFDPFEISADDIAQLPKKSNTEQFVLGDQYDLLPGNDVVTQVTLTTLVADEGDEETGNDSYIGALATEKRPNDLLFAKNYYAVRRHEAHDPATLKPPFKPVTSYAELSDEPIAFDLQTQMVSLLTQHMTAAATDIQRKAAEGKSPEFSVQAFRIAGGGVRYYAIAEWKSGKEPRPMSDFSIGAWIDPVPSPHVLALDIRRDPDVYLPYILNVVDLGDGKTGMILRKGTEDSTSTDLVEYRDGLDVEHMKLLQSVGAGE